jgi:hypothetical protein
LWVCSNINAATPVFAEVTAYPFKQPERVFFNPYNKQEMWVSSFGNGMKIGVLLPTGIPAFTDATTNDVYPNPSKGIIHLVNQLATEATIYDILGKQAGKFLLEKGENELNISFLTPGIYFLSWENKKTKIIIER